MAGSLSKLWTRGRAVPWAVVWETGRSLWFNSRDRVTENLSPKERRDFAEIVRQRRGRPWNLDEKERRRLAALVKLERGGDGPNDLASASSPQRGVEASARGLASIPDAAGLTAMNGSESDGR